LAIFETEPDATPGMLAQMADIKGDAAERSVYLLQFRELSHTCQVIKDLGAIAGQNLRVHWDFVICASCLRGIAYFYCPQNEKMICN
jgi:hypothetical protein